MTEDMILYVIVGGLGLLAILAFAIGLEKMIKVLLGNYILGSICLAASESIDFLVDFLTITPETKFGGMTYESLANFFVDGKTIIVLVLYVVLLVVIYRTSKIYISVPHDTTVQKGLSILLVPLTVLSMILTLQIAVMGASVIDIQALKAISSEITQNRAIFTFITMTPVWILLHGIATVLITSEMKIRIRTHEE